MLNLTSAVSNESTTEEISAANSEMWKYLFGKWTFKDGLLPFNPESIEKLQPEDEPELSVVWRRTNTDVTRAWSAVNSSRGDSFYLDGMYNEAEKSVASEFEKQLENLKVRRELEAKAIKLTEELLQVEMAGGRAIYDAFSIRRYVISDFNSKAESLIRLNNEISTKLLERQAKKEERKAARLAKKAEQVA
jgi:hypothetical protein